MLRSAIADVYTLGSGKNGKLYIVYNLPQFKNKYKYLKFMLLLLGAFENYDLETGSHCVGPESSTSELR